MLSWAKIVLFLRIILIFIRKKGIERENLWFDEGFCSVLSKIVIYVYER